MPCGTRGFATSLKELTGSTKAASFVIGFRSV